MSLKILYIVADGSLGGGTTHCLQLLRKFRFEFSLGLVTQKNSYLEQKSTELKIPTFGLNFFQSRFNLWISCQLNSITNQFQPNLIHVHGGRAAFFLASSICQTPVLYTSHGLHFAHKQGIAKWLGYCGEKWAMKRAHYTIFVSHYDLELAQCYGLGNAFQSHCVVYNGIAVDQIPFANPVPKWDLGFVGRLEYVKDPLLFIDIVRRANELKAVIIGDGSLRAAVQKAISDYGLESRLTFLGGCSHQRVIEELIPNIGLLAMTSHWEALGLSLLEAMAAGVPVVAPAVGGIPEVIVHGETGLLVEPRSSESFVQAIRLLRRSPHLKRQFIAQGRKRLHQLFSEKVMFEQLKTLYGQWV